MPLELARREPCPYCAHFAGHDEPSVTPGLIAEDETLAVVLAPAPGGGIEGHGLVITRRHVPTVFDLTREEQEAVARAVFRLARALRSAFDLDGLLFEQRNGVAAGQSVPHVHFHVVPRRTGAPWPPESLNFLTASERAAIARRVREHWEAS